MRRISWRKMGAPGGRHTLVGAVGVVLVSVLVAAAPALGDTQTRSLTIHTTGPSQSEDVTCLVPGPDNSCTTLQISETGTVTSNLAGKGTFQLTTLFTFPANGCHAPSADESTTFTFDAGTISTHTAIPASCAPAPPKGLLINGSFVVTGGTGAFAGATGGGKEFSSIGNSSTLLYVGTITF